MEDGSAQLIEEDVEAAGKSLEFEFVQPAGRVLWEDSEKHKGERLRNAFDCVVREREKDGKRRYCQVPQWSALYAPLAS